MWTYREETWMIYISAVLLSGVNNLLMIRQVVIQLDSVITGIFEYVARSCQWPPLILYYLQSAKWVPNLDMTTQREVIAPNHSGADCSLGAWPSSPQRFFIIVFFFSLSVWIEVKWRVEGERVQGFIDNRGGSTVQTSGACSLRMLLQLDKLGLRDLCVFLFTDTIHLLMPHSYFITKSYVCLSRPWYLTFLYIFPHFTSTSAKLDGSHSYAGGLATADPFFALWTVSSSRHCLL